MRELFIFTISAGNAKLCVSEKKIRASSPIPRRYKDLAFLYETNKYVVLLGAGHLTITNVYLETTQQELIELRITGWIGKMMRRM